MDRIVGTMALISNFGLWVAFALGLSIDDAASASEQARLQVSTHFLTAVAMATLAMLVHAIVLTYFMGTGRWIEETCQAYRLGNSSREENIRLKYRIIPGMLVCFTLLVTTGAFGAIADPASGNQMPSAPTIHFTLAVSTLLLNALVSFWEYEQVARNGRIVAAIVADVHRIRCEKGLD